MIKFKRNGSCVIVGDSYTQTADVVEELIAEAVRDFPGLNKAGVVFHKAWTDNFLPKVCIVFEPNQDSSLYEENSKIFMEE